MGSCVVVWFSIVLHEMVWNGLVWYGGWVMGAKMEIGQRS